MSGWGVIGIPFGDFPAYSRGRPARHPIADQSLFTRIVTICILVYAAANSGKQDYGGGAVMADTTVEVEADTAAAGGTGPGREAAVIDTISREAGSLSIEIVDVAGNVDDVAGHVSRQAEEFHRLAEAAELVAGRSPPSFRTPRTFISPVSRWVNVCRACKR
ncbi:MAG TPA: hypothetical protein VIR38_09255, partial [Thalassobaculum sp.]